jgi:hypothetical protein
MKKIIYFIFLCLFSLNANLSAHPGGHYKKGEGVIFNNWKLKNGVIVKGNFSFYKNNAIYLEQEGGRLQSVLLSDLSLQDQKLANFKINKYLALNNSYNTTSITVENHPYKNLPLLLFTIFIFLIYFIKPAILEKYILKSTVGLSTSSLLLFTLILLACSKTETTITNTPITNPITNPITSLPKTNYTFIDSAFASFKPALSTKWDDNYFYIASNGIPNHNMMIGITSWQQQVPITQPYADNNSWSIPLQPAYATTPLSTKTNLMKGAVAIAVNGIPIFNALNNRGEDSYLIGELDNWGGHCGRGDDYHYHAAPLHLSVINGLKPIAFALDGFPVYGSKEPDGSSMAILDTCHGHIGSNNVYHYHGTIDYPYVIGAMKGKVTIDPATPAPENQILPQAFTKPVRPATSPLKGATITDFANVGTNGYLLTYKIGTKNGYVKYSWDAANKYTFILTDTSGVAVTNTYQR